MPGSPPTGVHQTQRRLVPPIPWGPPPPASPSSIPLWPSSTCKLSHLNWMFEVPYISRPPPHPRPRSWALSASRAAAVGATQARGCPWREGRGEGRQGGKVHREGGSRSAHTNRQKCIACCDARSGTQRHSGSRRQQQWKRTRATVQHQQPQELGPPVDFQVGQQGNLHPLVGVDLKSRRMTTRKEWVRMPRSSACKVAWHGPSGSMGAALRLDGGRQAEEPAHLQLRRLQDVAQVSCLAADGRQRVRLL